MSHSEQSFRPKSPDDPSIQLPASLAGLRMPMLVVGVVLLIAGVLVGAFASAGWRLAMTAYLTAFMYCATLSLGGLFFVIIQHLTRAGWSATVRRVSELLAGAMPVVAILFIPILVAAWTNGTLYDWSDPGFEEEHHIPASIWAAKSGYLNAPFFTVRALIYFAVWIGLSRYYVGSSKRQDETGEIRLTERMQFWSGPSVILFSFSLTFAAFDWVMSLAPMWFSTMFGVYIFTGSVLSAIAATTVLIFLFQKQGAIRDEVNVEHYHDLAKLTFGFVVFWAYIAFSQYMLIWYGNIPEETEWFFHRETHGWATVGIILVVCHWLLPFLGLMSMYVRRRPALICFWAVFLLIMHYIDLYWAIMPEGATNEPLGPMGGGIGLVSALLCMAGMGGLYLGTIFISAGSTPLIPVRDPRLPSALAFENS